MAGLEGGANLALSLEAADAGAVPGSRINHDKGAFPRIDLKPLRRNDADKSIIDRPFQPGAGHDQLGLKAQDIRCDLSQMLLILVAALAHEVGVEQTTLPEVSGVFVGQICKMQRWEFGGRFLGRHGLPRQLEHLTLFSVRVGMAVRHA